MGEKLQYLANPENDLRPDEMFMGSGNNWEFNSHTTGVTVDMKGEFGYAEFHFEPFNTSKKQTGNEIQTTRMMLVGLDDYIKGSELRFGEDDLEPPPKIIGMTKSQEISEMGKKVGIDYTKSENDKGEDVYYAETSHDELENIVKNNQRLIDNARKKLKTN